MPNYAYTRYDIKTCGCVKDGKDCGLVEVHFTTNDDEDTGYPGVFAQDIYIYRGPDALEKALKHTGKSRQGIGQRVFVTLDGEEI